MKSKLFILVTIIAMLVVAVPGVGAQDDDDAPVTVTFTEAEINDLINERPFPGDRQFDNTVVDLQPGAVEITTEFTRRNNGEVVLLVGTLVPQYDGGGNFIGWAVDSLLVDGQAPADGEASARFGTGLFENFGQRLRDRSVQDVLDVEITDVDITYTLAMEPRDIIGDFDREAGTYTLTEAELNNAEDPDRLEDRFENRPITDVFVDFQPGQVVISGVFDPQRAEDTEPFVVAVTIVPVFTDAGELEWQITAVEIGNEDTPEELSNRISENLVGSFTQDLRRAERRLSERVTVTAVEINDTEIIYTLDLDNAE
jgi:hypothetical protein